MKREYHKWFSPALGREMELLVFGDRGRRVLVFPTRKNRFFEFEDHGMIHSLRHEIKAGNIQLFCVDGVDEESLYCFEKGPEARITRHLEFERYILEEVLPFTEKKNPGSPLTAHGSSFGAYHAVTIAMRNPAKFSRVLAFSGRYDLTLNAAEYHTLFYGYFDERLHAIMPSHFVPNLPEAKQLRGIRKIRFTLVIGEDDPFYADNVALVEALQARKGKIQLHTWCGNAHRWRYWRQMIRVYAGAL